MAILSFFIGLLAAITGAISGIGGGILIKPALDATHDFSIAEINFLSGTTVLVMVIVSLLRSRKDSTKINYKMTTMLGIGAASGGLAGQQFFELLMGEIANEQMVGAIQSIFLLVITLGVLLYLLKRDFLQTRNIQSRLLAFLIGLILGIISAFLGIGGGPMNIAILYYFFSMEGKEVTRNSLFIVLISQFTSLSSRMLANQIPEFSPYVLAALIVGCVAGAFIGSALCCRMNNRQVERFFSGLLIFVAAINLYNFIHYLL